MLGLLLQKDFRHVLRNPWPLVLNLGLPLAITALFAFAFGGGKDGPKIARIRVGVVDEDRSLIGSLMKSALNQGEAAKHFEQVNIESRTNALRMVQEDKISAAIVVPANFTRNYLEGQTNLSLEIIKNPAQSVYPAIVEQLLDVAVAGLNAVSRNLRAEFPGIGATLTNEFDLVKLGVVVARLGARVKEAGVFLESPPITYRTEVVEAEKDSKKGSGGIGVFGFILPGMASAFLLFLADHSLRDVHREHRLRTLDRLRTVSGGLRTFVGAKIVFAALVVLLGAVILFGSSGLVFRIPWKNPALMLLACAAYALFAAGFLAALVSIAPNERRSETINNILLFTLAFAGGSYIPSKQLPEFMQRHICPLMPNYWFTEAIRGLQEGDVFWSALAVVLKLGAAGIVLGAIASWLLHRRLTMGGRA